VRANLRAAAEGWLAVAHTAGKSDASIRSREHIDYLKRMLRGSDIACLWQRKQRRFGGSHKFRPDGDLRFLLPQRSQWTDGISLVSRPHQLLTEIPVGWFRAIGPIETAAPANSGA